MNILYSFKRHVSLYYGSMNFMACVGMFKSMIAGIFLSENKCRIKLCHEISKSFNNQVGIYAFTSARGSLAAFLKVSGAENKEVLLSSYTCLAVPTAVIAANAKPKYLDIDTENLNIKFSNLVKEINTKTHTIIAQHTLGNILDITSLRRLTEGSNIFILEDCALSIGSEINNKLIGLEGDASIYSLELSKTITTGWGGILIINNAELKEKMDFYYSNLNTEKTTLSLRKAWQIIISGISYNPVFYNYFGKYILYFGYKYKILMISTPETEQSGMVKDNFIMRLNSIQSIFAIYQWKLLNKIGNRININFNIISAELDKLGYFNFRPDSKYFCVTPRVSFLVENPEEAICFFLEKGIEMGKWFDGPLSPEPKSDIFNFKKFDYPNSYFISQHVVNLPCHSRLSIRDVNNIIKALNAFSLRYPTSVIKPSSVML